MNEKENNPTIDESENSQGSTVLEYSVGEICKCYYNDMGVIDENGGRVIQMNRKCQGYCRVIERNPGNFHEYTVEVYEPVGGKVKRLPGCCLRKVKILPYTKADAVNIIGRVVRSKSRDEYMQIVTVSDNGEDGIRVNDIDVNDLLEYYEHVAPDGYPCGKIVMLKADEAFGGEYGEHFKRHG